MEFFKRHRTATIGVQVLMLLPLALLLVGCGLVSAGTDQYNFLITDYEAAQAGVANATSCISLAYTDMNLQMGINLQVLQAFVAANSAYRKPLEQFGTKVSQAQSDYSGKYQNYLGPDGKPLQPNQLDLGALAQKQAMPGDLALTLQVYSTSFVEAGMPQIPTDSTKNLQNIIDEKINMSFACVKSANDAIQAYNTSRGKVPGDVVGTLAQKANIRDLPRELPYFVIPASAPPVVPTFSVPQ
ncbi:MAG: hypothetical protein WCF84_04570 [Anaerolineae bacterium]